MSGWQDLVTASLIGTERAMIPATEIPGAPAPAEAIRPDPDPDPAAQTEPNPGPEVPVGPEPAFPPAQAPGPEVSACPGRDPAIPLDPDPGPMVPTGPIQDPAAVLLDRAALLTAARRAGRRPGRADPLAPAELDPRPPVNPAAGLRLARMLRGQNPELLAEWLAAAAARGLRPPSQLLPALLDRARRPGPGEQALPRLVVEAGGPRAKWLAELNPEWEYAANWLAALSPDQGLAVGRDPASPQDPAADDLWRLGRAAQRRGYLAALLARDPAAARTLITGGWAAAGPGERAMFLAVLAEGLTPADEPLLEAGLDDQAEEVRSWAAYMLARLPGSALSQRMAARARGCLHLEHGGRGPRLTVQPPAGSDHAMRRDGITPGPAAGRSQLADRTRLMLEIVSRTPLGSWTGEFGLTATQIAALPAGDWAPVLLVGWSRAAIAQAEQNWMAALVNQALTGRRRPGRASGAWSRGAAAAGPARRPGAGRPGSGGRTRPGRAARRPGHA